MQAVRNLIPVIILSGIALCGCGHNPSTPEQAAVQAISKTQGWTQDETQLRQRVLDAALAGKKPSDADWATLVETANVRDINFIERLAVQLPKRLPEEKYQTAIKGWCIRLMKVPETEDHDASLNGLRGYKKTNATDVADWATKLTERGGVYPNEVASIMGS